MKPWGVLLLGFSIVLTGCSSKHDFGDVDGVLVMGGKPLANVLVEFHPEPNKDVDHAPSSEGTTDEQGRFRLYCAQRQRDGAVVGNHRICLIDLNVKDITASGQTRNKSRFSLEYSRTDGTDLRQEVKGGKQQIEITVTRR